MNSLPPELHLMIFKLLPVKDTIRLQLVSKQWYRLLNSLKHQRLTITNVGGNRFWPIKSVHMVNCIDTDRLIMPMPPLLRSVRKLTTCFYFEKIDLTRFCNQFTEMEELTCYSYCFGNDDTIILNLQHLKKFTFKYFDYSTFDLRTPRLTHLVVLAFGNCNLYFPDRLRRLETNYFDREVDFSQFKNLEFLCLEEECWPSITNSLLIKLSSLK